MARGTGGARQLLPTSRRHLGAKQLDRAHQVPVGGGTDAELEQGALMTEDTVLEEDLLDDLSRAANEVGAAQVTAGLEALAGQRRPVALPSDAVHGRLVWREGQVGGPLRGVGDEAVGVDAQGRDCLTGATGGFAMKLGNGCEPLRHSA